MLLRLQLSSRVCVMDNVNVIVTVSETNNNTVEIMSRSPSNHPIVLESFDLAEALAVVEGESCLRHFAASNTFVSNLEAVDDMAEDDVCSVCMEGFGGHNSDGGNKRIPCGHVYHSNCITLWLSYSNSCPLCRRHIYLTPEFHSN